MRIWNDLYRNGELYINVFVCYSALELKIAHRKVFNTILVQIGHMLANLTELCEKSLKFIFEHFSKLLLNNKKLFCLILSKIL